MCVEEGPQVAGSRIRSHDFVNSQIWPVGRWNCWAICKLQKCELGAVQEFEQSRGLPGGRHQARSVWCTVACTECRRRLEIARQRRIPVVNGQLCGIIRGVL